MNIRIFCSFLVGVIFFTFSPVLLAQTSSSIRTEPGRIGFQPGFSNRNTPSSNSLGEFDPATSFPNDLVRSSDQKPERDILNVPLTGDSSTPASGENKSEDAQDLMEMLGGGPDQWTKPKKLSTSIQVMLLLTVLTLAPSILLMTTCFVRVIVVLGLLRQAIGAQQLPPSQVITALSIFITILVMAPVWNEIKNDAILPYTQQEGNSISLEQTINRGVVPLKRFMARQIAMARNVDDIWLFHRHLPEEERKDVPKKFADVPFKVLLPAYMISELKVAFLLGFQIYLPFLVIDIVVSSIAISMGMMMLPPVIISLPFKLILFVLVNGWHLVVGMLLSSFVPYS